MHLALTRLTSGLAGPNQNGSCSKHANSVWWSGCLPSAMISVMISVFATWVSFSTFRVRDQRSPRPCRDSLQMPSSTALSNEHVQAILWNVLSWNVRCLIFNLHISLGNREIKVKSCNSDGGQSPWEGAKTCRDHFWHLGRVPQKHEIVSRICCMMHACCGRQMWVKGNWIQQLQPALHAVLRAMIAAHWAVVIVVTLTGRLPPWPYTKHSCHTAGS